MLLGPQPLAGHGHAHGHADETSEGDVGRALADLGVRGPVALVTAGWQERESEDEELVAHLGVPATNLRLHARSEEVLADDTELRAAYKARQERLRHLQEFHRVRLDFADEAALAISVRHVEPELIEDERRVSVELLRYLDREHLGRCDAINAEFEARWRPGERPAMARHRAELRALVEPTEALVIAGGHVASMLNRMRMFDLGAIAEGKHVIAWSAGAMVLCDRIVLFHDFPPYGKDVAQTLGAGLGLAPGVVVLPDARRRVRLDDGPGIARFAQRMAPAQCLAMDFGARLDFQGGRLARARADRLTLTGEVERGWTLGHGAADAAPPGAATSGGGSAS